MQETLTWLYNTILSVGGAYLGISFLLEMVDFWQRCEPQSPPVKKPTVLDVEAIALPAAQGLEIFPDSQPMTDEERVATPSGVAADTIAAEGDMALVATDTDTADTDTADTDTADTIATDTDAAEAMESSEKAS